MAKNKITASFRLVALLLVLLCTILSKVLQLTYLWAASDITVALPLVYVFRYGYMLFGIAAVASAVSTTVYAYSYFGKKTAVSTGLISAFSLFIGKAIMFIYNLTANRLSSAQLVSGALSYLLEVLFDVLVIIVALILSGAFAKKRDTSNNENAHSAFSPLKCAFLSSSLYYVFLVVDLSAVNVIPFFVKYSDPTKSEIVSILSDYLYYLAQIPVIILLTWFSFIILSRVTGRLKVKQYYQSK